MRIKRITLKCAILVVMVLFQGAYIEEGCFGLSYIKIIIIKVSSLTKPHSRKKKTRTYKPYLSSLCKSVAVPIFFIIWIQFKR